MTTMAILFDARDEYTQSILERAKVVGEIDLADLESILMLEGKPEISMDDVGDTIDALAGMGIEIDDGVTQEQTDAEFQQSMKAWTDKGNTLPQLTGEGWAMLIRAQEREKLVGTARLKEEAAQKREILRKRSFVQNLFAELGPRIRRERRR
jgi:hypothetical protein